MSSKHSPLYVLFKRLVFYIGDTSNVDESALCSRLDFCHDKQCEERRNYSNFQNVLTDPLSLRLKEHGHNVELEILESGTFICQCNGMICQAHITSYHKLLKCNLATKKFKLAPETCLPINPPECTHKCGVRFGCDPKSDNYKLVRIICYGEEELEDDCIIIFPPRVEMHTLGTESWKEISIGNVETDSTIFWPMHNSYYFNGICYWMGQEQEKEYENCYCKNDWEYVKGLIVSLSMRRYHILLPEELYGPVSFSDHMCLSEWKGSLALFGFYRIDQQTDDTEVGIWVMDDIDGVKTSWTLKVSFRPPTLTIQGTLNLWKSDEMIMVGPDGRMISYNFETKETKPFPVMSVWQHYFEILVCMDSLVFR